MTEKYLCAVGDSFIFGAELVAEHFFDFTKTLSNADLGALDFNIHPDKKIRTQYYDYLDSMRFSALIAKRLGYNHINYAQGGSSQEGIKLQTHLLLLTLRDLAVSPSNTLWFVGLTSPLRVLMYDEDIVIADADYPDKNYALSRLSYQSFVYGQSQQTINMSNLMNKELTARLSVSQLILTWAMHVIDTVQLLRSVGVLKIYVLHLWECFVLCACSDLILKETKQLVMDLFKQNGILDLIITGVDTSMYNLIDLNDTCVGGHFNQSGNEKIANYLLPIIDLK
jgi:hypothetical protein